jgi:hypothetical protein
MAPMSRYALFVAVIALTACEPPPGAIFDAGQVYFDGGLPDLSSLPSLDGNMLPLDGGTSGFAHLVFTISDGDTGLPVPARVIFRPPPGAGFADSIMTGKPDPMSPGSFTGAVVGPGVLGSPEGVMLVSGQGVVPVPPGTYSLFITRGPEYEATQTSVTVGDGDVVPVATALDHVVDTRGWLSADMHVHVGRSFDSKLPAERRVISMVSNGVEIIVPTDHNVSTDLGPVALSLGYGDDLVGTVIGNEFNFWEGHGGAYPVPYDPTKPGGGAPPYQGLVNLQCVPPIVGINCLTASDAFPMMHAQIPGTTVVTINHPFWSGADLGYFTNIQWGAGTSNPLPSSLSTVGMFDALEVLNGYQTNDVVENNLVADWFFLLGNGYRVTALGSSDTHKINWVRSGWPRTWLRLPNDKPGETTGAGFATAIRKGRAIASTGPFVTLTVDGGQIGDQIIPVHTGQLVIGVTADAPSWIALDEVKVFVNGKLHKTFPVTGTGHPRFSASYIDPVDGDAWVVAFASSKQILPPDVVGEYSHENGYEMTPWAITNPVFVDGNADGKWQPSPSTGSFPSRTRVPPEPFHRVVPPNCDASERIGSEPPLDAPAQALMPLLYE